MIGIKFKLNANSINDICKISKIAGGKKRKLYNFDISEVHDYDVSDISAKLSPSVEDEDALDNTITPRSATVKVGKQEKQLYLIQKSVTQMQQRSLSTAGESIGNMQAAPARLPFLKDVLLGDKEPSQHLLRESSSMVKTEVCLNLFYLNLFFCSTKKSMFHQQNKKQELHLMIKKKFQS